MKITTILLLSACLTASAGGLAQKVTLSAKNVKLEKVFKEIKKQAGYVFFYDARVLQGAKRVNIQIKNGSVEEVLRESLQGQPFDFSIERKTVTIVQKSNNSSDRRQVNFVSPVSVIAPLDIIKGTVKDDKGNVLAGVSIVIRGTQRGTSTGADGGFSIEANVGDVLEFTMVGYQKKSVTVDQEKTLTVVMEIEETIGNEVVVIGYGSKKKEFLTGAVSTVDAEVFQSRPITNALAALQGEVSGTYIQRYSGQPGSEDFNLNVRGPSSINGAASPLVLIDGVVGNLALLNPSDIESISVLKDAQASIYGARAAGGVFLVTTKKGRGGATKITYNNNFAVTKMTGMMESPTNYQMAIMDNEANIHNGAAPMYTPELLQKILNNDPNPIPHPIYGGWMLFFTNTDWEKELLENGFQQRHAVSVSGNSANSNYYLSGSYSDQHGVVKYANDNNKLYNLRLNYDYTLTKWLKLESKVSFDQQQRSDIAGVGNWVIGEAIFGMPNHPVYTPDGKFFAQGGWSNAVGFAKEAPTSSFNTRNLNTNFKLIADLGGGLKLNLQSGTNYTSKNSKDMGKPVPLYQWDGTLAYYSIANPGQSWIEQQNSEITYQNYTGYLQYNKRLGDRHDLDLMVGGSYEKNELKSSTAGRYDIVSDEVWDLNLGVGDMYSRGGANHWAIGSYFTRLGYVYNDKYLLEANIRYDGTSKFQLADKQWGLFPGISLGWRISKEAFLKDVIWLNELKLRASYGKVGNQESNTNGVGIGYYDFIQKITLGGAYPFGAGRQEPAATLDGMVAYNRTWETLVNRNVGLDAALLSNRLNFSFDYFIKRNENMLISVAYPSLLGATAPTSNAGELKTWGFETSIGWNDKIGDFKYSARLLLSDAQNKLVNLGGLNTYTLGMNNLREGYPINSYFAYVFDGIIRNQSELDAYKQLEGVPSDIGIGDARFKDLDNDGKISLYSDKPGSDGDVKYVGNTAPRYSYGINLGAQFRGLDLSVFLQAVGKRTLFRVGEYSMPWSDWWRQPPAFYYGKTWNEDRPDAEYPRLTHGNIRWWNYQASTLQQIDASYIRLKNIQIGYTLPQSLIGKISLSRARIYLSGQDLWEAHHVKGGWDPESADWGGNYPFQRYYSFGIDVTF